ncbi:MAG: hypothetical protein FDZ75_06615 [Actinobacteria bacterium]|nr:MAG: hypothetical protein FDZ75_06615 [Actinomycetota bacterium]
MSALARKTATLEDALGAAPDIERITEAAVAGIAEGLGISLREGTFSALELAQAQDLLGEARLADDGVTA